MPTIAAYDHAMARAARMVPAVSRLGGKVAMAGTDQPWRIAGQEAVVYRLDQGDQRRLALRGFLADDIDPRTLAVYNGLSTPATLRRLHANGNVPIVRWVSLESDGVAIPGPDFRSVRYPLVAMEWVGGPTILDAADRASRGRDRYVLRSIADAWLQSIGTLASVRFVHGDLTSDNALIHLERGVVLVDYDRSWWPGLPEPMQRRRGGAYLHRKGDPNEPERRDYFGSLVIYVSLRLLAHQPELRAEYGDPSGIYGGALLFSGRDLADPDRSQLFRQLRSIDDPECKALAAVLHEACLSDPSEVPSLPESAAAARSVAQRVPHRDRESRDPFATWGISSDQDEQTANAASEQVSNDRPSTVGSQRIARPVANEAPSVQSADLDASVERLQVALADGDAETVAQLWPSLRHSPLVSRYVIAAHEVVTRNARASVQDAMRQDDVQLLLRAIETSESLGVPVSVEARRDHRRRVRRRRQQQEIEDLVHGGDLEKLATAALSGQLNVVGRLGREGEASLRVALQLVYLQRTIELDDDARILSAWTSDLRAKPDLLDARSQARVHLASARIEWKKSLRTALKQRDTVTLARLVDEAPEGAKERVSASERRKIDRLLSQQKALEMLEAALRSGNDRQLVDAMNKVEAAGALLPPSMDWNSVRELVDRLSLVSSIRRSALSTPPDYERLGRLLPAARDAFGHQKPYLGDQLDFEELERDVQRAAHAQRLREAIATGDEYIIAKAAVPDPHGALQILPEKEQRVVRDIIQRRTLVNPLKPTEENPHPPFSSSAT
jgi:hypothetical protein